MPPQSDRFRPRTADDMKLLAVNGWKSSVYGSTCYQILLPGLLVWCVCLSLSAWSKADAWDAVTAHDGYAVGREGPLVSQRTCGSHLQSLLSTDTVLAEQVGVSFL